MAISTINKTYMASEIKRIMEYHGLNEVEEYKVWRAIKQRCLNPNNKDFHNYGGRGITVCNEWVNSFKQFYLDMGSRPSKYHSLERTNNNIGYSKNNCIWATKKQQAINRRTTIWLDFNGEKVTRQQLADTLGITRDMVKNYINQGQAIQEIVNKFKNKTYVPRKSKLLCMGEGK